MIIPFIVFVLCAVHFIKSVEQSNSSSDYIIIHGLISGALILISMALSIKLDLP